MIKLAACPNVFVAFQYDQQYCVACNLDLLLYRNSHNKSLQLSQTTLGRYSGKKTFCQFSVKQFNNYLVLNTKLKRLWFVLEKTIKWSYTNNQAEIVETTSSFPK